MVYKISVHIMKLNERKEEENEWVSRPIDMGRPSN
jgi:hypothetical protein